MLKGLTGIVVAMAAGRLAVPQIPVAQTVIEEPEAYVVYATVIVPDAPVSGAHAKQLVIQRETVVNKECTVSGGALETDWKPVADDFTRQNASVRFVSSDRDLHLPYVVVPRKTILEFFTKQGGNWPAFYRRYPDSGGYVEVSAVGFDAAKTRAMVYVAHHCGGLCGSGSYHLLEKVSGAWREALVPGVSACMWIS